MNFNVYGDTKRELAEGHGIDVASQRLDELDRLARDFVEHQRRRHPDQSPLAMDMGCGAGGLCAALAAAGADCLGVDRIDFGQSFQRLNDRIDFGQSFQRLNDRRAIGGKSAPGGVRFLLADFLDISPDFSNQYQGAAALIVSQRALHYTPYPQAVAAIQQFRGLLRPDGRLFLGLSGLCSELAEGYAAALEPLEQRFARLAEFMANRHGILQPICLYEADDVARLLTESGFMPERIFTSAFGNIKAVAIPR